MSKEFHVFISSTLEDLKNERHELCKIILELGHIPVNMDNFDRNDKNEWKLVKKHIEEADYFISLVAHQYGMLDDKKSSMLENEYAHAVKKNIPVLALIIDDKARWKKSKIDSTPAVVKALGAFKKKLGEHPCESWTGSQDLLQKAQKILIQEMNLNPSPGWVRGDMAVEAALANELARLSAENSELKKQIQSGSADFLAKLKARINRTLRLLNANGISLSFYYAGGENWENIKKYRYLRLFKLLVPELYLSKTTSALSRFIGNTLNPDLSRTIRKDYPVPSNTVKKIMSDLEILKIVRCTGGDNNDESWELTEFGRELYYIYRVRQMEKAALKKA